MDFLLKPICLNRNSLVRYCSNVCRYKHKCKLLIVGGGCGGCSIAWRFAKSLKKTDIIVLEPSKFHYCQPLFTLVSAGCKTMDDARKPMQSVLPIGATWIQDAAELFNPGCNNVYTQRGDQISYEYMVIAMGLKNDYDDIPGLKPLLDNPAFSVSTIYSPEYCEKTWCCLKQLQGGLALFTFPERAGKCSGAAHQIMYLSDDYLRKKKIRERVNFSYFTACDNIYGVPKYASTLQNVMNNRNIVVNKKMELVEINKQGAVFVNSSKGCVTLPYNFLHVTPSMSPPSCLSRCEELASENGYLDIDRFTLQHRKYPNVYGLGDCINAPNSKTAAAVGQQSRVVEKNLSSTMLGVKPTAKYDGYGACPILTSYKRGILSEFVYDKIIKETFPFDQSKERKIVAFLKKTYLPRLYWKKLIKGKWDGPDNIRKLINPFGW